MKTTALTEIFIFLVLLKLVSSECDFGEYFCRGTVKCIDPDYLCDGDNDCGDMEDENECTSSVPFPVITLSSKPCSGNRFHCPFENKCINPSWVCDTEEDCLDGRDEKECWDQELTTNALILTTSYPASTLYAEITTDCDNEENCKTSCKMDFKGCYCENGFHLEVIGRSLESNFMCAPHTNNPTMVLLLASNTGTSEMLAMDLRTNVTVQYLKRDFRSVMRDVDFDSETNTLFWNDVQQDKIYSYKPMNNTVYSLSSYSTRETPIHIQWDWIAKNFFFISHRTIKCCDQTFSFCKTLHTHRDNLVMDFVIAPKQRYIFWNFLLDRSGTVFRAEMDGSDENSILQLGTKWHSLAVDHSNDRIYWASEDGGKVGSCDFNGQNRNAIVIKRQFTLLSEIEIFENHLYFVHETQQHVERCSMIDGSCLSFFKLERKETRIQDIKIVHPSLHPAGINYCYNNECQELCLPNQKGYTCHCSDNGSSSCETKFVVVQLKDLFSTKSPGKDSSQGRFSNDLPDLDWLDWVGGTVLILIIVVIITATIVFYFKRRSMSVNKEEGQVAYSNMKSAPECRVSVGNLVTL